ncbi:MAG: hypothetical protein II867_04375 [Clostridia bacterium]|nr:hypothetical protein [Clostridia bacterium]
MTEWISIGLATAALIVSVLSTFIGYLLEERRQFFVIFREYKDNPNIQVICENIQNHLCEKACEDIGFRTALGQFLSMINLMVLIANRMIFKKYCFEHIKSELDVIKDDPYTKDIVYLPQNHLRALIKYYEKK